MKNLVPNVLLSLVLLVPAVSFGQTDLIAPVVGSVTGLVENDRGAMVPPQAAVQATVVARDNNGVITAEVSGTASCTGGLGLHFAFKAQYITSSNTFVGMYSDIPGSAPYKALSFTNNGGFSWTAQLRGNAPSPTGLRAYDLSFNFEIPETAIFTGKALPKERTYQGSLSTTQTVVVPLNIPQAGINQELSFNVEFSGSWSAVSVPKADGSNVFTGQANGNFASTNTVTATGRIPGFGALSIPVSIPISISGSFGGSLFLIDKDTVSFRGSWVGSGANKTFGGDTTIDINFQDISAFPFTVSGTLPVTTGIAQLPQFDIRFSVSGNFPLSMK